MIFARIWNGLLAGAVAALPATLCLAAGHALLMPGDPIGRETLSPIFLIAWGICSLFCGLPATTLGQWLLALWAIVAMLFALALIFACTALAPAPIASVILPGVLLALAGVALRGRWPGKART